MLSVTGRPHDGQAGASRLVPHRGQVNSSRTAARQTEQLSSTIALPQQGLHPASLGE
jgi:hypothetical protein